MTERDDPLWDPRLHADDDLRRMTRLLSRYRSDAKPASWQRTSSEKMPNDSVPASSASAPLRWRWAIGIIAMLLLIVGIGAYQRLQWRDGAAWQVTGNADMKLDVGATLTATSGPMRVDVARIGELALSPGASMSLRETRSGRHRVDLLNGHLHARIWAPPGHFGVRDGAVEVVDLGCEFDVWKSANGQRRLLVSSGWVEVALGEVEVLVPAGHELRYDDAHIGLPVHPDASPALRSALSDLLARRLAGVDDRAAQQALSDAATHADAYTLLAVLTRWPMLAEGPLYPRLAALMGLDEDTGHRLAWADGGVHAINEWWDELPRQPKQWWREWRDLRL